MASRGHGVRRRVIGCLLRQEGSEHVCESSDRYVCEQINSFVILLSILGVAPLFTRHPVYNALSGPTDCILRYIKT